MTKDVFQFCEEPFCCPICGSRLDNIVEVGADDEGPIYTADCPIHGEFHVQSVEDEEADDEDE